MLMLISYLIVAICGYICGGRLAQMDTKYPASTYRTAEAAAHIRLAMAALDSPERARQLLEVALQRLNDDA